MSEQQAVVDETKTSAAPDVAVDSARDDDVDALISQFEKETTSTATTETKTSTQAQEPAVSERLKALEQRYIEDEISKSTDRIFDGIANVSPRLKRAFLEQVVREKPTLGQAWLDPSKRSQVERIINKEAKNEFNKQIDVEVTADVNAIAAAVKGASAKITAEPAPDFGQMSDAELREYTRKNFKF